MTDHHDLRRGIAADLRDDLGQDRPRLRGELVAVLEEVEDEGHGARGLRGQGGPEDLLHLLRSDGARLYTPRILHPRRLVRLGQRRLLAAALHGEGAGSLPVLAGEEHVQIVARGLGAAGEEDEAEGGKPGEPAQGNRARHSLPSPVRTTNSVPRTPSTAAGVFTFM